LVITVALQALRSPVLYPVENQFCRWADDPCVQEYGLTEPVAARWIRSSLAAARW